METVTHEGNVYEIGKHYLFGNTYQLHKLLGINSESDYPFRVLDKGQENGFTKIHLVDLDEGTITPAPIELIDGAAYMFDYQGSEFIGLYEDDEKILFMVGCTYNLENCSNIRPMKVVEK